MSEAMMWLLLRGVWETLAMTFVSGFFGFVLGLAGGRAAVRYPSGANRRQCQTVPHAVGAGEYFPLHPVHYPAGLDDSVYPRDRRYLYRPGRQRLCH